MVNYFAQNQSASSAGATSSFDVSGIATDWTLSWQTSGLTSDKNATVAIEESCDGFVADVRSLIQRSFTGPISSGAPVTVSLRKYQAPDSRFGTVGAQGCAIRVNVRQLDAGATVTWSLSVQS